MRHADVFEHVRPASVTVECAGRRWTLCLDSAYAWIGAVGFDFDTLAGVLPGGLGDDDVDVMFRLGLPGEDLERRWVNAGRVAVGRAGGRDWWWTVNLIRKAVTAWPYINGQLLLHGVNARTLQLPDWLDACYMLMWRNGDEKERIRLDTELSMPPRGVAVQRSPAATRQMLDSFAAD